MKQEKPRLAQVNSSSVGENVCSMENGSIHGRVAFELGRILSICLWLPVKESTDWMLDHADSGLIDL